MLFVESCSRSTSPDVRGPLPPRTCPRHHMRCIAGTAQAACGCCYDNERPAGMRCDMVWPCACVVVHPPRHVRHGMTHARPDSRLRQSAAHTWAPSMSHVGVRVWPARADPACAHIRERPRRMASHTTPRCCCCFCRCCCCRLDPGLGRSHATICPRQQPGLGREGKQVRRGGGLLRATLHIIWPPCRVAGWSMRCQALAQPRRTQPCIP